MSFVRGLLLIFTVVALVGCAKYVSPRVVITRQDMDNVINLRGIPRQVDESFYGGPHPFHTVTLFYPDMMYQFQTDAQKSHTVLTVSQTISWEGYQQKPIPAWFKAKYPALNWAGVPTKK